MPQKLHPPKADTNLSAIGSAKSLVRFGGLVLWWPVAIVLFIFSFQNCSQKNPYQKETELLDSIKIVLQVKLNELKKAETNSGPSFSKYDAYSKFLGANLKDTIERSQANALKNFISAGKTISNFNKTRPALIEETEKTISQLQKLSFDLREQNIQPTAIQSYVDSERTHAEKLVISIEENVRAVNIGLINFRNAIPRTEELIKQINAGKLPAVVTDTSAE